ncbi:MAG TPA: GNAT family N-acetyltransferase [Blastocatellia bacterium]|nr:GNAT family N-acetyltransferase [Blastocatellia bacterium]
MELKLKNCSIRLWQPGDERSLVQHANNYKVWRNVRDRFPHPYTIGDAHAWVEYVAGERPRTNFAIAVDGVAVGGIGLALQSDIYRRSAEIGYWLGELFWGRGIMSEAVRAFTTWGFANFGDLCRIYAGVLEWNPASRRVLEKAGFQFEARLRQAVTKDGQTMDDFIYAALRE